MTMLLKMLLVLTMPSSALAGAEKHVKHKTTKVAAASDGQDDVDASSAMDDQAEATPRPQPSRFRQDYPSAYNRIHEHVGLALKTGYPGTGVEMNGGELLTSVGKHWQFTASYFTGSGSLTVSESSSTVSATATNNYTVSQLAVGTRYFLGNSFFLGGECGQRSYVADIKATSSSTAFGRMADLQDRLEVQSLIVNFKIGNQWLFDSGFFITGEWIGYELPLNYTTKSTYSTSTLSSADMESFKQTDRDLGRQLGTMGSISSTIAFGFSF